jgi:hypothetical protein
MGRKKILGDVVAPGGTGVLVHRHQPGVHLLATQSAHRCHAPCVDEMIGGQCHNYPLSVCQSSDAFPSRAGSTCLFATMLEITAGEAGQQEAAATDVAEVREGELAAIIIMSCPKDRSSGRSSCGAHGMASIPQSGWPRPTPRRSRTCSRGLRALHPSGRAGSACMSALSLTLLFIAGDALPPRCIKRPVRTGAAYRPPCLRRRCPQ